MKPTHVAGAAMFGAAIVCTRGIYSAELQAIARALAMFPVSRELEIHSDSEAALAGIRAFGAQTNDRRRQRMQGRPLLQLIDHLLHRREQCGTLTFASHVKAHTTDADIHSVGNRLSDFHANRVRIKAELKLPGCVRELPLSDCEHHMVIADADGLVIADDIRRSAVAVSNVRALPLGRARTRAGRRPRSSRGTRHARFGPRRDEAWLYSPAGYSVACCHELHRVLLACSRSSERARAARAVRLLPSSTFFVPFDQLPRASMRLFPSELGAAIRNILSIDGRAHAWLERNRHLGLMPLLLALFPHSPPTPAAEAAVSAEQRQRHLTALLVGAFTSAQVAAAAKSIGLDAAEPDCRDRLLRIRLCCLESIGNAYHSWKEAADPPSLHAS